MMPVARLNMYVGVAKLEGITKGEGRQTGAGD